MRHDQSAAAHTRSLPDVVRLCAVRSSVLVAKLLFNALDALALLAILLAKPLRSSAADERTPKPRVLVVGASFAGLHAQRKLAATTDLTLLDFKDYFEYTPGVLRCFVQPRHLRAIAKPLPRRRNRLVVAELVELRDDAATVRTADGATRELGYDYLLLATGTRYPCEPVSATPAEADLAARQRRWERAADELDAASSVLVLGGGPVGVELAAELAAARPGKRVTLATSGGLLCSALPQRVGEACRAWLESHGVELRFHARVDSVAFAAEGLAAHAKLTTGHTLHADLIYDCRGGAQPNSEALRAHFGDALDERGRVRVGPELLMVEPSSPSRSSAKAAAHHRAGIFALGDVMVQEPPPPGPWGPDLKLGHTAELNADAAVHNLRCRIRGEALEPYPRAAVGADVAPRVFCVSLGEGYGVLAFNGVVVSGWIPAVAKAVIEWSKVAACAERPIGIAIWTFGDAMANWISRKVLAPPTLAELNADDKAA